MFQLGLNLAENNICTSLPLDNSDVNKKCICFSLMYKSGVQGYNGGPDPRGSQVPGFLLFCAFSISMPQAMS